MHVEQVGNIAVVRVVGEIDLANASRVGTSLAAAAAPESGLVVDLTGVTYIDSAGIGELFALAAQIRSAGGLAVVIPDGSPLHKLFKITAFDEAAPVCPTQDDAISILGPDTQT
ncbi:MAG TPA: STAS domain-containing protein [Acidimicrobiales bacterium]|nr:STAS domain-containing protein [Acidimicrobiales bacterium]